jgi:hypothetical protein
MRLINCPVKIMRVVSLLFFLISANSYAAIAIDVVSNDGVTSVLALSGTWSNPTDGVSVPKNSGVVTVKLGLFEQGRASAATQALGLTKGSYTFQNSASSQSATSRTMVPVILSSGNTMSVANSQLDIHKEYQLCIVYTGNFGSLTTCNSSNTGGGEVVDPPAVNVSCDLSQNDITLNHGSISGSQLEGHIATANISVTCTDNVNVNFKILDTLSSNMNGQISLSDVYISDILLNNYLVDSSGVSFPVSENIPFNIEISSVLHKKTTETVSGDFSGSGTIVTTIE